MTVIIHMAHARWVRLVPYVIGLSVALVIALSGTALQRGLDQPHPPVSSVLPHSLGRPPICGSVWWLRFWGRPSGLDCATFSAVTD
jgi:hypothetical protein